MEYVLFFATVFAILLIIMIFGVVEERRSEKLFAQRMKSLFGKKIEKKRSVDYISFYADNENDRIKLLVLMRKMDHNLKVPFFEVLDFIVGNEKKNMLPSVIADILLVIVLILAVFVNSAMFLPLIIICIYQAFVYYRIKRVLRSIFLLLRS